MLAGPVESPPRLAPNRNQDAAEARAKVVLGAKADMGAITQAQAQATIGHPAYTVQPIGAATINYAADWIAEVPNDLAGGIEDDILAETTIDPKPQSVAEAAIIDELAAKSVKFSNT